MRLRGSRGQPEAVSSLDVVVCPSCGDHNRVDAAFCRSCGTGLVLTREPTEYPEQQVLVPDEPPPVIEHPAVASEPPEAPGPRSGRIGRLQIIGLATVVVIVGTIAAVALTNDGDDEGARSALRFATVRRTDLTAVRSMDGEVASRGEQPRIIGRLGGTLTEIAAERSTVERGQPLWSIDGDPVILFYGALPSWRDIGPGVSPGADVKQLEENLEALGFDPGEVDETYTAETTAAVDRWLASIGLEKAGVVRLGRVVFERAAITVAERLKTVGGPVQAGDEMLKAVSFERVVTVSFSNENDLASGDAVTMVLPGRRVPAKVSSVVTDPGSGRGEELFLLATIVPEEAGVLTGLREGADVDVEVFQASRKGVLAVPVTALLAREGGGYAVEVERGSGRVVVVAVTPGLYATNLVEIRSGLQEGDRVVVP